MKTEIGYHASHEQFSPSALLDLVRAAEAAGFNAALSSDHFHPWSRHQGESGYAWSWLGAALQATSMTFGVVCAPGQRYHPAIIAQATATLMEMFPDRFWVSLGSGQLLNEGITGECWPVKADRNRRLLEAVKVIRELWTGEPVIHHGSFDVEEARLYSLPAASPHLVGAAITPETAQWVGGWADGLITISRPRDELSEVVDAFRSGGGEGKPMYLKVQISYARTEEEARRGAWEQWRTNIFDSHVLSDLRTPEHFDALAKLVRPEELAGHVRISSEPGKHLDWLRQDMELGFEHIYLHNVNKEHRVFIEDFAEHVLPSLRP
ncbi:MAG: TIGR03885 family FMN-dependent LLM class oxidoreductase [Thermoleophilia bacterium]|nr:TIGR03885 family FMN-dependent LLM class oxidoreductase [Thermoleophilia bacterium]